MPNRQPALEIDAVLGPDACLILIRGELDAGGCPDLELALADAVRTEARRIIIDLEELTFIDAGGLQTLLTASRHSAANGGRLQVTRGKGYVAEMFRLTALDKGLPLIDPCLAPPSRLARRVGSRPSPNAYRGTVAKWPTTAQPSTA